MSKENAENTPSSNHKDSKNKSSDSDDLDEGPTEVCRKVLSENLFSPINSPTRGLPSVSRKSSSPKTNNATSGHQRQSASSSYADQTTNAAPGRQSAFSSDADQTYANSQAVESTSEQIGDGSTSDVIDPSTIDSRTLKTCNSEKDASTKGTKILCTSEPPACTGVEIIVQSNISNPMKDSPLVFLSSTGHDEISSSQEQNFQLCDYAADVLLSDGSSKQVPSSGESDDSDDEEMYEFPRQPLQRLTTPESLEEEIRSVFEMIFWYVYKEIKKTRTKRETLQINLSRKRAFVRCSLSQTLGQSSAVSQRIASELLPTLTEHGDLEFTYQGPSQTNDQLACLIQESTQYSGHECYGKLSQGSYGACLQRSYEYQEPTEELSQAFSGRSGQASSTLDPSSLRLAQTSLEGLDSSSKGLITSSSKRLAPSSSKVSYPSLPNGLAPSPSRGLSPSPSEGLTPSSSGGLLAEASMVVENSDLSSASGLNELPKISRLFSHGYLIGLEIGSENFAQIVSVGRALQSRFGQMIQDLQLPGEQTQGIPQELLDTASRIVSSLAPRTTHLLNTSVPRNIAQIYFIGLFVGFSRSYTQWSGRRPVFCLSSRSVKRLLPGLPSKFHRDLLLMSQRSLQGSLIEPHRRFTHGSSMGSSNTPIARFSRGHSLPGPSTSRPFRNSVRGHGSELRSSLRSTRPSDRKRPANIQERIHVLLTQLVLDLNMIRALADLILRESSRNFEKISSYLLCFEIMREDYREKESRFAALEKEISKDVQRYRREAFAILHIELLIDILEHGISRVDYGAMLVRTHYRLDEVRTLSNAIRRVVRTAKSYVMWTKED